jgi:DUF4097 and DUF4098 domain-containing protein YvlB
MMRDLLCLCLLTLSTFGQFRENTAPELTCDSSQRHWGKDYGHSCTLTELKVPVTQRLDIEAGPNGGVSVKGWNRQEVWVRARIDTGSKQGEAAAKDLAKQVTVEANAGRIGAKGPASGKGEQWWSVSFEIFVPHKMDLQATTVNGGVNLADVEGQLRFRTMNGGVNLARVAGDVQGRTMNGGVNVDLEGARWNGQGLDVTTTNGGVNLVVPASYSANLRAATTNGGFTSDFGTPSREEQRGWARKEYERILGNGGAPVKVMTTNGGVRIKKK